MSVKLSNETLDAAWKTFSEWKGLNPDDLRAIMDQAKEANALLERCERMEKQLEAVKRLAKAQYKDTTIKFDCDQDALEFEHAFNACLALGIDPKEL